MQRFDLESIADIMQYANWRVVYFMQHLCDQMVVLICKMFSTDLGKIDSAIILSLS